MHQWEARISGNRGDTVSSTGAAGASIAMAVFMTIELAVDISDRDSQRY